MRFNIPPKLIIPLILILLVHGIILSKLIFFPYPELFIYPYLTNQGFLPYKQIFDQHFPGLMFLPVNFNNLGMTSPFMARLWLIGVVFITQVLIYFITYKTFRKISLAFFASLLYLLLQPFLEGWVLWIDSFLPVLLLPAFYFTYQSIVEKNNKKYLVLAGLFFSMALAFKQVVIPLIGMSALLLILFRSFKDLPYFIFGLLPITFLIGFYFWSIGIVKDFWYWTVIFNMTTFAESGKKPPFLTGLIRIGWIFAPAFFLLLLKDKKLMVTILVFLIGSLASAYARFDFVHFQPALPFLVIAVVALIDIYGKYIKFNSLLATYLLVVGAWLVIFYRGHIGNEVLFFDNQTITISQKIRQYTHPKEEIFLFGPPAHLYYLSDTIPAGRIFVFQFPWFLEETENQFLSVLERQRPKLIIRDRTVDIEGRSITNFALKLDTFIDSSYEVFDKTESIEFMRPK